MYDLRLITNFVQDRRGVTAVEYGIMAALIATALVTSVGVLTSGLSTAFSNISSTMITGTK